jgi:hypothetical protein
MDWKRTVPFYNCGWALISERINFLTLKQAAGHFNIFASAPNVRLKIDPYLNLSSSALDAAGIEIKKPMIKTDL